jgi:acetyl esterase/lipase
LTGDADVLTTVDDIRRFHVALDDAGVKNYLEVFPGGPHSFDFHPKRYAQCLDMITRFVEETVGLPSCGA